jgi:hypothetical protein
MKTSRLFRYPFSVVFREEYSLGVAEENVLKVVLIFEGEVRGGWRKMHSEELSVIFTLHQVLMVMKSRRMR